MIKNMNLSAKLSIVISSILVVILSILIIVSVISSKTAIENSTVKQLESISKSDALQIQSFFNVAENAAKDINTYLTDLYNKNGNDEYFKEYDEESKVINGLKLSSLSKEAETYAVATSSSTVINTDEIYSVGIMFEPYAFSKNYEGYSFYITNENGTPKIASLGKYSEYSQENYYKNAFEKKQMIFTAPYEYNGILIITVAIPFIRNNNVEAVIAVNFDTSYFKNIDVADKDFPSLYSSINMDDGSIVYNSMDSGLVGKNSSELFFKKEDYDDSITKNKIGEPFYIKCLNSDKKEVYKFYYPIKAGNVNWFAVTSLQASDLNKSATKTAILLVTMSTISIVIIIFMIIVFLRKMLNPIKDVVKAAQAISEGYLNISINSKTNDEIGMLAKTFNNTAKTLNNIINEISRILSEISNNNLVLSSDIEYKGEFIGIKSSMHNIIENLNNVLSDINQSSDRVLDSSEQVSHGAQSLAQGATEQASSIEELSSTLAEISQQINQNASNALEASKKVAVVGNEANESNEKMKTMISAMNDISNSSLEIEKIIKTIEDISFQTNILALNATVEAARAGEAGKGFAVVADEVRNLANKSSQAAKNTTNLIQNSINAVKNGTKAADETAKSLASVINGVKIVEYDINEISKASSMQAVSVSQVNQGVNQITEVIQINSATAEESASASEELSEQSKLLKQMVGKFKLKSINSNNNSNANIKNVKYNDNSSVIFTKSYDIDKAFDNKTSKY